MGDICRKLMVVAAMALFVTGCTGESLGPEYGEIGEEESKLQFYAPGLEGGYRKFIYGQDEKFIKRVVGVYGPKQGEFPHGQLILIEMPPGRHFTRINPPQETIDEWGPFKNRAITLGPEGTAINSIGRIDYAAFLADNLSCILFRQPFGTVHDTGRGTQLLDGYYCKGEAPMMTEGEAVAIVKAVGHKKYGAIEPPEGWNAASEATEGSEAYARSAEKYFRAGDYDKAIREYTEAIRLDPAYIRAYNSRGIAYKKRGDYDLAIRDYDEAIRLDPGYARAYNNRGIAYNKTGDYDLAIRDFDEAIRLDPGYALAYNNRGNTYREKGDNDRAIRDYDEAIRIDPASSSVYNNRCWVYGLMRRTDEALRDCNESLRLKPDAAATLDSRALVFWLLGDHDKARLDLERAREINPKFSLWRNRFREFEGMF